MPKRNVNPLLFGLGFLVLLIWQLSVPVYAHAQTQSQNPLAGKNVLILHSHEGNTPVFLKTGKGLSEVLQLGGVPSLNQFFESLDLRRNPGPEHRKLLVEQMRMRYGNRKLDMIITMYPEALGFVLKDCRDILPHVPILATVLPANFDVPRTDRRLISQFVKVDISGTLEIALRLVPGTKRVYVMSGAHQIDRTVENQARRDLRKWEGELEFVYLSQMPFEDMLATVSSMPPGSIILLLAFSHDSTGTNYTGEIVAQQASQVSTAPIFGILSHMLSHGIVGGSLVDFERVGTDAGQLTLDILKGAKTTENMPNVLEVPHLDMFDWRQLKHWNLSESALPKGSIVINKETTLWDFRYYIIGGLALMIGQSFLIAGLMMQQRRRRSAEEALKERLNFEILLAEISALFVNLPADRIDSEIEGAQRRICEFLNLGRSSLGQVTEGEPGVLLLTHIQQPQGGPPLPERPNARDLFPWVVQKLLAGETVAIRKISDLPPEAGRDRESCALYEIKSVVVVPLSVGGGPVFGILTFSALREERDWPETVVKGFELIAQVFANALVRKSNEQALRMKTEELDQFFGVTLDLLCVANIEGYFVRLNPAWEEILGYSREDLMARRFFDFIHPDDLEKTREIASTLASQERVLSFENRYRCKDGTYRHLDWRAAPAGNLIYASGRDITERLEADVEARKRREELAHVARIAMMGELTTSLAHEINQPLAAIRSNAEAARRFLSQAPPDISEVRQILDDIIRDDRRAGEVVQKVRALVRKEKPVYDPLDLNRAIQEVVALIRGESLLRGLSVIMELDPNLNMVRGDRVQLQQVILNLILNSAHAMRRVPQVQRKIIVRTAMQEDETVKASVTDFGTGIDENNIDLLFEPFYTTKPEGLGMGLSISQRIIHAHGGTVGTSNNPEGGATFAFTLPAHQGDPT